MWAKGTMGMCKLTIKKLKATNQKGVSLALRGLTSCQQAQSAGTIAFEMGVEWDWL
jgi:hypothetical protein